MSLDVYLEVMHPTVVFEANATHNLGPMAKAAGIYQHLWRPEELGILRAVQLQVPLLEAITRMKGDPEGFKLHNPPNGWGNYEWFLEFLEKLFEACLNNPSATVRTSR